MNDDGIMLSIYVDDLVIATTKEKARAFFNELKKHVKLKTTTDDSEGWSETSRFLGMHYEQIKQGDFRIFRVSMPGYARKVVSDYESKYETTISPRKCLSNPPSIGPVSVMGEAFREQVGALLWLTRCFRPDLAKSVSILGEAVTKWTQEHTKFLENILGVVLCTADYYMEMKFNVNDKELLFDVHSDANLAAPRSTSGYFFVLVGEHGSKIPLAWRSAKQQVTCTSTAGSEYIAASNAAGNAMTVFRTLQQVNLCNESPKIFIDNQCVLLGITRGWSSFDAVVDAALLKKTEVLLLCQLNDLHSSGVAKFEYINSNENLADSLTKITTSTKQPLDRNSLSIFGIEI